MEEEFKKTKLSPEIADIIHEASEDFKKTIEDKWAKSKDSKEYEKFETSINDKFVKLFKILEETRKKYMIAITASIILCFILLGSWIWFSIAKGSASAEKISLETQRQLKQIVGLVDEKTLQVRIENELKYIMKAHKTFVLLHGQQWKDYKSIWISEMANQITIGYKMFGVEPEMVYAICATEDHFRWWRNSHREARGLMQIMPETWDTIVNNYYLSKVNPYNPPDNVKVGILHILGLKNYSAKYYKDTSQWSAGDIAASYNSGGKYYGDYLRMKKGGGKRKLYDETANYIKAFEYYYNEYKKENYQAIYFEDEEAGKKYIEKVNK